MKEQSLRCHSSSPGRAVCRREGVFEHVAITFLHGQSRMLATLA
jgi:hypothetical protein